MKKYMEPELEVLTFTVADVITASGDDEQGENESPIG